MHSNIHCHFTYAIPWDGCIFSHLIFNNVYFMRNLYEMIKHGSVSTFILAECVNSVTFYFNKDIESNE